MNKDMKGSVKLVKEIIQKDKLFGCEVYISPAFPFLNEISNICELTPIKVIAQNVSEKSQGAYTGEVSVDMLKSIGVDGIIVGHSERRKIYGETDEVLRMKLDNCSKNNLEVFFCVGETLEMREKGKQNEEIENQLNNTLFDLPDFNLDKLVIAYEPVWAIGTGKNASPKQVQEIHRHIRNLLNFRYGKSSDSIPIVYGGSLKPENSNNIFSCPDVDGGLVGSASLNSKAFLDIISSI
mgnify:FL=1